MNATAVSISIVTWGDKLNLNQFHISKIIVLDKLFLSCYCKT